MKTLPAFLLGALALGACQSPDEAALHEVDLSSVVCICGEPEAAFEGCPHPLCIGGEGNPENPDCVCAPIEIGKEGER